MNDTTPDATAIFAPIWRRKWLILFVALLVGAASYLYFKRERSTYLVQTQVFLGASAEEALPTTKTGKSKANLSGQSTIVTAIVVEEVRRKLRASHNGAVAKGAKVRAKLPEKSELMDISVEGHSRKHVAQFANLIAQTYIKRQETKRHRAINKAITISRTQLARIEAASAAREAANAVNSKTHKGAAAPTKASSSAAGVIQATNLQTKINELESTLGAPTAVQLKPAKPTSAKLESPKPRKDAEFGFVIGLVLAAVAAIAASRFDRRLRTIASLESALGLPMLTVLPKVTRPIVRDGATVRPSNLLVEPLRRFDTELMISAPANGAAPAPSRRVVLIVSPDPGDGKSTLIADLALVQRDAGKHVLVIEANFRRPVLARMLGLEGTSSLPEVLSGRLEPDDAMQRVLPAHAPEVLAAEGVGGVATATQTGVGSLWALTAERTVANPPALLAQPAVAEVLRGLAERFDSILIDAPSPLEFSDAVPLFGVVDAIVAIARAGHSREASALRLRQMLASPGYAPAIGMIGNFVASRDLQRYGFSTGARRGWLGVSRNGR